MRMILDYPQQIRAGEVALQRIKALGAFADHASRYDRGLNFPEYVAQMTESIGAEMAVAKYFGMIGFGYPTKKDNLSTRTHNRRTRNL